MAVRVSKEIQQQIAADYASGGETATSLAQRYSVSRQSVMNYCGRYGVSTKRRNLFSADEKRRITQMYVEEGVGVSVICKRLGRAKSAVLYVLRIEGVEFRGYLSGDRHPSWKGGRLVTGEGYVSVLLPVDHPFRHLAHGDGRILEHRLVMTEALGRPLTSSETVHHINGDRADNRLENLQLRLGRHGNGIAVECQDCGSHNVKAVELHG